MNIDIAAFSYPNHLIRGIIPKIVKINQVFNHDLKKEMISERD